MKILFVINPKSGVRAANNLEEIIAEEAKKLSFEYAIYQIKRSQEQRYLAKEIKCYKPDIVAAAGGDGTVSLLAQLLIHTNCTLLIIPTGSANGMAKELGIWKIDTAIDLLSSGEVRKIDLLRINNRICIHLADVGLNARIVKRFKRDKKRGIWSYARHLLSEIFLIKQYRFHIRYDKQEIDRKAVSLTFANASRYGSGAVINPIGKVNDGLFELIIVKPFPRIKLLSIAWKMFIGNLKTSEYVEVLRCTHASVRSSKKTTLQIDGEVIGKVKEIHIEVINNALKVLVPPGSII